MKLDFAGFHPKVCTDVKMGLQRPTPRRELAGKLPQISHHHSHLRKVTALGGSDPQKLLGAGSSRRMGSAQVAKMQSGINNRQQSPGRSVATGIKNLIELVLVDTAPMGIFYITIRVYIYIYNLSFS